MKNAQAALNEALSDAEVFTDGDWVESKDQDPYGGVRLIQLADVGDGKYLDRSARFLTPEKAKQLRCTYLKKGDVLVARMPDPLGRACIFEGDPKSSVTVVDVCIMRPDTSSIDPRWLMHSINFPCVRNEINRYSTGTTRKRISRKNLSKIKIPLPSLPEQKRISAILDKADVLREKSRQAIAKLDELFQSVFLDMFGDPMTNPKGWADSTKLGEVADIVSGITKGRKLNGKKTREIPYMAVVNVQDRHLNLQTIKTIQATEEEITKYRLIENDLLLTEGGDPDKLGRGSLWKNELPESIHQNHIFRVRLHTDKLNPYFLNWLIGSIRGKRYFLRSAKQTTGIASINMTQLRNFPLLIPPIEIQNLFYEKMMCIEKHQLKMISHRDYLNILFASLQQRAFKEEL